MVLNKITPYRVDAPDDSTEIFDTVILNGYEIETQQFDEWESRD